PTRPTPCPYPALFRSHVVRATLGRRPATPVGTPFGRDVPGVLGLAAGMDKDATTVLGMDMLGFGHVEVGTITAHPQPGNDRPRLDRKSTRLNSSHVKI